MAHITESVAGTNVPRFLDLIAFSEGTSASRITEDDGYDVIVSSVSGPARFSDYSAHPFAAGRSPQIIRVNPLLRSTAAGRYQELVHNWTVYHPQLKLPDFSPLSQDLMALQHLKERRAVALITAGKIQSAISLCATIWASMPGNDYDQGGHTMTTLLAEYAALSSS